MGTLRMFFFKIPSSLQDAKGTKEENVGVGGMSWTGKEDRSHAGGSWHRRAEGHRLERPKAASSMTSGSAEKRELEREAGKGGVKGDFSNVTLY